MDYAIFKTGGKQYRVKPGDVLDVELLPLEVGEAAEFAEVLAVSDGGEVNFGAPHVAGARGGGSGSVPLQGPEVDGL